MRSVDDHGDDHGSRRQQTRLQRLWRNHCGQVVHRSRRRGRSPFSHSFEESDGARDFTEATPTADHPYYRVRDVGNQEANGARHAGHLSASTGGENLSQIGDPDWGLVGRRRGHRGGVEKRREGQEAWTLFFLPRQTVRKCVANSHSTWIFALSASGFSSSAISAPLRETFPDIDRNSGTTRVTAPRSHGRNPDRRTCRPRPPG